MVINSLKLTSDSYAAGYASVAAWAEPAATASAAVAAPASASRRRRSQTRISRPPPCLSGRMMAAG